MYVCMEWIVWITWWIIFCNRYSRLYWVYNQETYAVSENPLIMYVYIYISIYIIEKKNKDMILSWTIKAWDNGITWGH